MAENQIILKNNLLLICGRLDVAVEDSAEWEYLKSHFCGQVQSVNEETLADLDLMPASPNIDIYLCGDLRHLGPWKSNDMGNIKIIAALSYGAEYRRDLEQVTSGEVPINLHNAAVYYRDCLSPDSNDNYFDILQIKHKFQALTDSNKSSMAFRKGIYLSEVDTEGDTSQFHLLRCSTNLSGPTLAFADEDRDILRKVNKLAEQNFEHQTHLNHVLAQVYENTVTVNDLNKQKEHKAKIKSHSDKTKDMPAASLIAFCTFYSSDINQYKSKTDDRFNRYFKDASVLTQLRFRLKPDARSRHPDLAPDFRVTLYPNSVLLIPLSTNRLYTHEIVPPTLPVGRFPTRLGYVVRCSKTRAVFKDDAVFIQRDGKDVKLVPPKEGEIDELKGLYQKENVSADRIEYRDFDFSLNEGDYLRPIVE